MHTGAGAAHGNTRERPHTWRGIQAVKEPDRKDFGAVKSCAGSNPAPATREPANRATPTSGVHPSATPGGSWHRLPHIMGGCLSGRKGLAVDEV